MLSNHHHSFRIFRTSLILISLLLTSCHKEPVPDPGHYILSGCLPGTWEQVYGVKIIEGDTLELFENGNRYTFWYGVRESDVSTEKRTLTIGNETFRYDRDPVGNTGIPGDSTGYDLKWHWVDSYWSKSLVHMPIWFNSTDEAVVYRVLQLDSGNYEFEYRRGWGGVDYFRCRFRRAAGSPAPDLKPAKQVQQLPAHIAGNWKLSTCNLPTNDSVFVRIENDTLIHQFYEFHYSHFTPGYYTKEIDKSHFTLSLSLDSTGFCDINADQERTTWRTVGYWYWTDDLTPHRKIYIEPTVSPIITDYELTMPDDNTLNLQYGNLIYYTFKRQ
jgi:hypothetical protein